ncbi:MAG: hypothetical protein IKH57_25685 [Clostridia bacterium]|nr:hypothetical protein [Clostridia bacterium]
MPDLEKVIQGLECCVAEPNEFGDCNSSKCPYASIDCIQRLMVDVLVLLKVQRPRVLTLEELKESDDPIFFETQSGVIYDWAIKCTANGKHVFLTIRNSTIQAFRIGRYGISWRCWTSKPTTKQREAAPWQ